VQDYSIAKQIESNASAFCIANLPTPKAIGSLFTFNTQHCNFYLFLCICDNVSSKTSSMPVFSVVNILRSSFNQCTDIMLT